MYLSGASEWILHYMQHQCFPNESRVVNSTDHFGESSLNDWISIPILSVYISCLWCISLCSGHYQIHSGTLRGVLTRFSVAPAWLKLQGLQQNEYFDPNRTLCAKQVSHRTFTFLTNLLTVAILSSCLLSCHALQGVEGKPLGGAREALLTQQDPRYNRVGLHPRVVMPPLDLGFRGQTSSGEKKSRQTNLGNMVQSYQSDESSGQRWDPEPYRYAEQLNQQQPQQQNGYRQYAKEASQFDMNQRPAGQFKQYPYGNAYAQNPWTTDNRYDPNTYPLQYLHSRDPSGMPDPLAQHTRRYAGGGTIGYPPVDPMQQGFQRNTLYQPPYPVYDSNTGNLNRPIPFPPGTPNRNPYASYGQPVSKPLPPPWYGMYGQPPMMPPYYAYENMAMQPRHDTLDDEQAPIEHKPTTVLGHSSNYEVISEAEIERRLKEYNDYLASNPSDKQGARSTGNNPTTARDHHDSGLRLKGSQAHEKVVRDFKKLASRISLDGVDTLFDEIDLNRDGVIKLEEFRTFLWFHEIGVQD